MSRRQRHPSRRRALRALLPPRGTLVSLALVGLFQVVVAFSRDAVTNEITSVLNPTRWVVAAAAGVLLVVAVAQGVRRLRRLAEEAVLAPEPPVRPAQPGTPMDLPYPADAVGREADIGWLVGAVAGEHVVVLAGRAGVGTSTCVVEAANRLRARFPDGQVYLDLRPDGRLMPPGRVLAALCRKVGMPERAPASGAGLRAHLDRRRVLLVLDNAADPDQVRPLLPPAAHTRVLVAGGPALAALEARVRLLAEPSTPDAVAMLLAAPYGGRAGRAPGRRPDLLAELAALLGRQPYALRSMGAVMAGRGWGPGESLATLRRLPDEPGPPGALAELAARWDLAYQRLGPAARRVLRRLALAPQPLPESAVAALAGLPRERARRLTGELTAGGLLDALPDGRHRLRPALLWFARLHLRLDDGPRARSAAQLRLLRLLARTAQRRVKAVTAAVDLLPPGLVGPVSPAAGTPDGAGPVDPDAPWLARHEAVLTDLIRLPWGTVGGLPARPSRRTCRWWYRLAVAMCAWYAATGALDDWAATCRAVLASPLSVRERRRGSWRVRRSAYRRGVAAWAHNELGVVHRRRGDSRAAVSELTRAMALRHRRGAAQTGTNLGLALLDSGELDGALDHLQRATRRRARGDLAGRARGELGTGVALLMRGDLMRARRHLEDAANGFAAAGEARGYAAALTDLVPVYAGLGERLDAEQAWTAAVAVHEALGDRDGQAAALLNAATGLLAADPARARHLLEDSLRRRGPDGPPAARGRTLFVLGEAAAALAEPGRAARYWREAESACAAGGDVAGAARARARLGGEPPATPDEGT